MPYRGTVEVIGKLACPRCSIHLEERFSTPVERDVTLGVFTCRSCQGAWLDVPSLRHLVEQHAARVAVSSLRGTYADPHHPEDMAGELSCPACFAPLSRYRYASTEVTVDACRRDGMWFDRGELGEVLFYLNAAPPQPLSDDESALRGPRVKPRAAREPEREPEPELWSNVWRALGAIFRGPK